MSKKKKTTLPKTTNSNNQLWGVQTAECRYEENRLSVVSACWNRRVVVAWGVGMFPFFFIHLWICLSKCMFLGK